MRAASSWLPCRARSGRRRTVPDDDREDPLQAMLSYLVRRCLYGMLVLLGVNLLTFFLFFTVNTPDDMARLNIGGKHITQDLIDKWKIERGYDKPLYLNDAKQGSERITDTIFWERSVSLFELRFGRSDAESAGDIGPEVSRRMW